MGIHYTKYISCVQDVHLIESQQQQQSNRKSIRGKGTWTLALPGTISGHLCSGSNRPESRTLAINGWPFGGTVAAYFNTTKTARADGRQAFAFTLLSTKLGINVCPWESLWLNIRQPIPGAMGSAHESRGAWSLISLLVDWLDTRGKFGGLNLKYGAS